MNRTPDLMLERRLEELSTLNAIGDILNREPDFAVALKEALQKLVELLELRSGWVFLTQVVQGDLHQGTFTVAGTTGLPPALGENDNRPLCRGSCDCQWLFRQGQLDTGVNIVHCSRLEAATGDKGGLELHASVPLLGRAGPVGILNLAAAGRDTFGAETLAFLTAVGRQLGTAFERAALLSARSEAAQHLAILEERQRFAAEMHDSVSQLLFAAELALQTGAAAKAEDLVADAQNELRALVEVLRPADLSGGLKAALARLAERTEGVVRVQLEAHPLQMPPEHAETLYRAAQEGVHNALKHAHATRLWLRCEAVLQGVRLSVEDDGAGLPDPLTEGFGLRSLRRRAEALGGTLRLEKETRTGHGSSWSYPLAELLLVDDHPIVREGLRAYLSLQAGLEVVGEAENVSQALAQLEQIRPDLVLLDVQLEGENGLSLLAALREQEDAPKVLLLTSFLDEDYLREALRLGAAGYLLKRAGQGALLDGIRAALRGERPLDPAAAALLPTLQDDPLKRLTPRELTVLELLAEGLSNKAVAKRLAVGEKTVKTHVSSVLAKLELKDRTQAALYARSRRL